MYRVLVLLFAIGYCADSTLTDTINTINQVKGSTGTDLQSALDAHTWAYWKKTFANTPPYSSWDNTLEAHTNKIKLLEENSATKEKVAAVEKSVASLKDDHGRRLDDQNGRISALEGLQLKVRLDNADKGIKNAEDTSGKKHDVSIKAIDEAGAKADTDLKTGLAAVRAEVESLRKDSLAAREKLKKDLQTEIQHTHDDLDMGIEHARDDAKTDYEKSAKTLAGVVSLQNGVSKLHNQAQHLVEADAVVPTTQELEIAASNNVGIDLWKFSFLLLASFNLGGFAMYTYLASKGSNGESETPLLG